MILILDNLAATILGFVVFVALFAIQLRVQESTVERTLLYSAKKQTLNFGEILERDLDNAGFGSLPGDEGITAFATDSAAGVRYTSLLSFVSADLLGNPIQVRYVASVADSATIDGVTKNLLVVNRSENDGSGWVASGATPPILADFDVDLLNNQNVNVARANTRKLRVKFVTALVRNRFGGSPGSANTRFLNELVWSMTIEPDGLKNQGFQG